ncbi:hypothetical protein COS74_04950 [bacterium CG06_land_8_20_14_3_00_33_50]|nr:MAG: hypothetical protein AUJ93_04765 [bacterium CG2_30_33_46]PIU76270.1 MAG: hypothetical protein COS74_04950 [bacterium CG06_land_8_20_14_3_00_33_50]PIW81541.1 MAG: hypothetical protein COZ97_01255 [bacterium CG_4_8_14_3_um_filter_33_28]PIY85780.1 MAG: hypothetical protein COY76_00440 [bacterium CG_4_10_14_0_8_um_filter_33_57]PJA71993.1 MAG: hypothetical protein CO152_03755 [bacterium CG_4_9_14_3_um_filter_33_26]
MCPFCPHNFGFGFGSTTFWIGTILSILFWIALIYFVYWLIRRAGWLQRSEEKSKNRAIQILNERFAKGEIDRKEYEERKKELLK